MQWRKRGNKRRQKTSIVKAIQSTDITQFKAAIAAGADMDMRIGEGTYTLLAYCMGWHFFEGAQYLLDHGLVADVNGTGAYFSQEMPVKLLEQLIAKGLDVNETVTVDDGTALHAAAEKGEHDLVAHLLSYGADVHIQDKKGRTPFDVATGEAKPLLRKVLEDAECANVVTWEATGAQTVTYTEIDVVNRYRLKHVFNFAQGTVRVHAQNMDTAAESLSVLFMSAMTGEKMLLDAQNAYRDKHGTWPPDLNGVVLDKNNPLRTKR